MMGIGETPLLLQPEQWPDDRHLDVMFLGRAVQAIADNEAFASEDLVAVVLQALINDDLEAVIIHETGEYVPVPARLWRVRGGDRILACEAIESEVLGLPLENDTVILAIDQYRREARHIYVTRESLDSFFFSISVQTQRAKGRGPTPDELNRIKQAIRDVGVDEVKSIEHAISLFGGRRTTTAQALREIREENQRGSE